MKGKGNNIKIVLRDIVFHNSSNVNVDIDASVNALLGKDRHSG